MHALEHFIKIFTSPTTYAKKLTDLKGYKYVYLNYVAVAFFFLILTGFLSYIELLQVRGGLRYFFNLNPVNFSPITLTLLLLVTLASSLLFTLLIPFILSGSAHLGVLILTNKKGFEKTFHAITPTINIGLAYIIIAKSLTAFFALLLGPGTLFQIINFLVNSVFGLIAIIHIFYAQTRCLQATHKINSATSFTSLIIIPTFCIIASSIFSVFFVLITLIGAITPFQSL